jgi:ERCC4-type nuclease
MTGKSAVLEIVADDREPESVLNALKALPAVEVSVARLELGDYRVGDDLLVERKTLVDFAVSVVDGRFFSQALRLARSEKRSLMILEGRGSDLASTGIRREALQGALISLSLIFGIPVLRSMDEQETARLILYAESQYRAFAAVGRHRCGYRPKGKRKRQLYILQGLPGIGPERAARLLDAFGSVEAVLRADVENLVEVKGLGRKTAEAIRRSVSESAAAYRL